MYRDKTPIDELFNDYLSDYEESPPSYLWDNIQASLSEKRKRRKLIFFWSVAASIAILISFTIGYKISNNILEGNEPIIAHESKQNFNQANSAPEIAKADKQVSELHKEGIITETKVGPREKDGGNVLVNTARYQTSKSAYYVTKNEAKAVNAIENTEVLRSENDVARIEPKEAFVRDFYGQNSYLSPMSEKQLLAGLLKEIPAGIISKEKSALKFELGGGVAPVWAFTNNVAKSHDMADAASLDKLMGNNYASSVSSSLGSSTEAPMTYSGGFSVNIRFSKNVSIKSGIYMSGKKLQTQNVPLQQVWNAGNSYFAVKSSANNLPETRISANETIENPNSTSFEDLANTLTNNQNFYSELEQQFNYMEIPIIMDFGLIRKTFELSLETGLTTGFLVKNTAELTKSGTSIWKGKTESMRSNILSSIIGLDLGYRISQKIKLNLQPQIRYTFNSISNNKEFYNYPGAVAIYSGITYSF
jgi:hypothetical protein